MFVELQYQEKGNKDDFKKIYGIGKVFEKFFNDCGVYWFYQVVCWMLVDVYKIEEELFEFQGCIECDNWIGGVCEEYFKKYGEWIQFCLWWVLWVELDVLMFWLLR